MRTDAWLALFAIAFAAVGFYATDQRLDEVEDRPVPTVTTTTSTTTTIAPGPTVPDGNVYRDSENHCFGTSAAEAQRRGLKPDPTCPGADL